MNLNELLAGDESTVAEWLRDKNLIHECDCGYTVYDVDDVNGAVQDEWGDEQCDEIYSWACDLSNRFGWLWIESSQPKHGIYHCQHCAGSEFGLLMDLEKMARSAEEEADASADEAPAVSAKAAEPCVVYVDESYTNEFPRLSGGALSFAAFIVPESAVGAIQRGVEEIIRQSYRGSAPTELKYSAISKHPALLERVGEGVAALIRRIPSSAVIAIYVPRSGLFGEQLRSLRAQGHYEGQPPTAETLAAVESPEAVEAAVRATANQIAQTIATCVGNYLGSRKLSGRIVFDPRYKKVDEPLVKALKEILPKTPINAPLILHEDAVVTIPPGPGMERLGDRIKIEVAGTSHETHGLQIADFIAGDVRTFFDEVPELLTEATAEAPLVNKRVLFPQLFRRTELSLATRKKLEGTGRSAVRLYREHFANGIVSCYTANGQMRNINLTNGVAFDIMD